MASTSCSYCFFFFNDTATTEIYTLSLHDALPICQQHDAHAQQHALLRRGTGHGRRGRQQHGGRGGCRSEEHTSELQSPCNLVCRLLLEKKKKKQAQRRDLPPTRLRSQTLTLA